MKRLSFSPAIRQQLHHKVPSIVVTGAGGWLGQALLEMLDSTFGDALPAHVTVFASAPRPLTLRSGRTLTPQYFGQLEHVRTRPSLIFHFAFLTRGHAQTPNFVATNRGISRTLRGFIERNGARGLFIPSSGAVYGPARVLESDMDRNPYGVLKHEDELVFGALAARLGFPAAIMRIFNLGGAFINNLSGYALACIIADVLRGTSVTLRAAQPVWRSYTHVEDVLNIATAILLRQLALPVFDTAGEPEIEVGDLAARVGRLLTEGEVSIIRPDWQNGAANRYLGDLAAYRDAAALAGVKLQSLDQQILDTANYIAHVARSR